MHSTAIANCRRFIDCYSGTIPSRDEAVVVEIGSQDINGSVRNIVPSRFKYVGVDMLSGPGVDIVLDDPYVLPFADESVDIAISSSCFEHSELFWVSFLEVMRILKPTGLFYLNVPSNGIYHRYPVDCWRFYPDSGRALVTWAQRNGVPAALLESYTSLQDGSGWNDFVAIFLKDEKHADLYPDRVIHKFDRFYNGISSDSDLIANFIESPEDRRKLTRLARYATAEILFRRLKLKGSPAARVRV